MNKKSAFTLAETLTVLLIIGAVSVLTIPTLMANVNKQKKINMLKKLYSSFEINIQTVLAESNCTSVSCLRKYGNKTIEEKISGNESMHNGVFSNIHYFNVSSECPYCFEDGAVMPIKMEGANNERHYSAYRLTNGATMALYDYDRNCSTSGLVSAATETLNNVAAPDGAQRQQWQRNWENVGACGIVIFDVNSAKGPNVPGKDRFAYVIVDEPVDGSYLVPFGYTENDGNIAKSQYNKRGLVKSNLANTSCVMNDVSHVEYGYNCTAKVMRDGWKMEY